MPNSRHYTSADLKNIFDYAFTKINFTEEGLTRDTGCTNGLDLRDDKYVMGIIQTISGNNRDDFNDIHNSHDWVKMLKHVFQNGKIIDFQNLSIFKEWKEFSVYSRDAFANKENHEKPKQYVLELKKFMAKLINHGAIEEVNCIHHMLHLAYRLFTEDLTQTNTSEKVASMLGGIFYDGLQLEGIIKSFTLLELATIQQGGYIQRVQQCSHFFKDIIEDPLFSQKFNKKDYVKYLMMPKLEYETGSEKKYTRKKRSYSLENTSTLDPDFIDAFKKLSVADISKSAPELSPKNLTEVTFSYSRGQKILPSLKEMHSLPLEPILMDSHDTKLTKSKKRLSLSIFTK